VIKTDYDDDYDDDGEKHVKSSALFMYITFSLPGDAKPASVDSLLAEFLKNSTDPVSRGTHGHIQVKHHYKVALPSSKCEFLN